MTTIIDRLTGLWREAMPRVGRSADEQVRADMAFGNALRRAAPDLLELARVAYEEHRVGGYLDNDPASIDPKCCDTCAALAPLFAEAPS